MKRKLMNKCLYSLHVLFLELGREFLVVSFGEFFFFLLMFQCLFFYFFSLIPVITSRQNIRKKSGVYYPCKTTCCPSCIPKGCFAVKKPPILPGLLQLTSNKLYSVPSCVLLRGPCQAVVAIEYDSLLCLQDITNMLL